MAGDTGELIPPRDPVPREWPAPRAGTRAERHWPSATTVLVAAAGGLALGWLAARSGVGRDLLERADLPPAGDARLDVERSVTLDAADAATVERLWKEPETLARLLAPFADAEPMPHGHLRLDGGRALGRWTMRLADAGPGPGGAIRWQAEEPRAPLREFALRLHDGRGGRTVATLRLAAEPPGGRIGRSAASMFGDLLPGALASRTLHYLKALAETGEIPTTAGQPAARHDTR